MHSVAKIGGAERVSQMLMDGLDPKRFTPFLFCPTEGDLTQWAKSKGIDYQILPMQQPSAKHPFATLSQVLIWRKFLTKQNIQILHTADPYCTRAILIAAKLSGVKVLCHFHFPFSESQLAWLFNRLPTPTAFVFCSQDLSDDVGGKLKRVLANPDLHTIHNGVDTEKYQPKAKPSSPDIHIGIIANLQERKGHLDFINMASILMPEHDNLIFHVIGGDILEQPRQPLLEAKVKALGLSEKFVFHGQVPDVLNELNALDIVVCASHEEAFPIAILEAMAMQKAIVSTNVNGIPEALEQELSGLMVAPHAPQALATQVKRLILDEGLRQKLAENAKKRVSDNFGLTVFLSKFEDLYERI